MAKDQDRRPDDEDLEEHFAPPMDDEEWEDACAGLVAMLDAMTMIAVEHSGFHPELLLLDPSLETRH